MGVTNAVVPDGLEVDDHPTRMPGGGGLVAGLIVVGLTAIFLASGGRDSPPPAPEETLPDVEFVDLDGVWNRLELPGGAPLTAVADLGPGQGYVSVGDGPQVWWSDEGLTWRLEGTPAGPRHVGGVAGLRDTVVVVGSETNVAGETRPAISYLGEDDEWAVVDPPAQAPSALEGVEEAVGRVVAWGWQGSPRDFEPAADALVLTSTDGVTWTEVGLPEGTRVRGVRFYRASWYFMGSLGGKPALFQSDDLVEVTEVPTDGLPYGWSMTDLTEQGIANLLDLGLDRTREWRLGAEGKWVPHAPQVMDGPVVLEADAEDFLGVGSGRLWTGSTAWADAGLEGEVAAVAGNVAVGGIDGQPAVWVRGVAGEPSIAAPTRTGAVWEPVVDLGGGTPHGPWPVGESWVVGVGDDWWLVSGAEVEELPGLAGLPISRIDRVGDEWVALPAMLWTTDGVTWEQRDEPWPSGETAYVDVLAVTETAEGALAVGFDDLRMWNVAATTNHGRSWDTIGDPAPMTPIDLVRPVPGGFTGVAARPRNQDEIVTSSDGRTWEGLMDGDLVTIAEPPALVTPAGRLVLLDTGEEYPAPTDGVTAVVRGGDGGLAVVAGGSLWIDPPPDVVDPPDWVELPLDPAHGLAGADVRPLSTGDDLYVLAVDRGRVQILRWVPES